MKVYTESVVCDLCGGPAVASAGSNIWDGRVFVHKDPFVCKENLKKAKTKTPTDITAEK